MSLPKETMEILEALAPELKESEDERIRKHIIYILNSLPGCYWYGQKEKDDTISYLEKQKDHFRDDAKMVEQPTAEWSEEDEHYFQNLIMAVDSTFGDGNTKNWLQNRLKSLRPHWKPSEEQIEALEKIRNIFHVHHLWDEINPILYDYEELIRDLQKLL